MNRLNLKQVVVSWSGGIDSTAVLLCLINSGYDCTVVSNSLYDNWTPLYAKREMLARARIEPFLRAQAGLYGARLRFEHIDASFIRFFSINDTMAIPQRNKRFIDLLMSRYLIPRGIKNLAMGEYIGVDTWVVRDHVPPNDCDDRALSAYLFLEYGMQYRFISLADFGESRYKADRLKLGAAHGSHIMSLTTNCMADVDTDCGECYKCVERAAAFEVAGITDATVYAKDPRAHPHYRIYCHQMMGFDVTLPYSEFPQHQ